MSLLCLLGSKSLEIDATHSCSASIEEALLLALVRLSAVQPLPTSEHALRVEKLLDESNEVQLSKSAAARARQYVHLARDTEAAKAVNGAAGVAPTVSLIRTLYS